MNEATNMHVEVELSELRAAVSDRAAADTALEAKACALMTTYGRWLPGPAKDFFRELATHLNWNNLKGKLK
jgi:hypothetical protein